MSDMMSKQLVSRREMLRIGSVGATGLSLDQLLNADVINRSSGIAPRATSCIIIHLNGGPSHLDMWDMKPNGPSESRGEFKPIPSSLPGIQLCEHLPRLSQVMHHCTLVRSMHHSVNNSHAAAVYVSLTGHDRGEAGGGAKPTDHPCPGAIVSLLRPPAQDAVGHVALPYQTTEGTGGPPQPGFFAGWLGKGHDPFWVLQDPNVDGFGIPTLTLPSDVSPERLAARGQLLSRSGTQMVDRRLHAASSAMTDFKGRAFDLLTSSRAQQAFEIHREHEQLRTSYGRNIYGQSILLARRLIEGGTRVVTMTWAPSANDTWDTHSSNFKRMKSTLLPQFDAACSTLLTDLLQRGMLDDTLVAVLGDFGRTPTINANDAGRDHWNHCYTILLAGGGIRAGYVHGASSRTGAWVADHPVTPAEIIATMYHLLGVDYRRIINDQMGRPQQIVPDGRLLPEILA